MFFIRAFCLVIILVLLSACGPAEYPGLPSLPTKDWLAAEKETPPNHKLDIYSPQKTLAFEDLVWLAIQQSPAISKGAINLEIAEIRKTDAKWKYLPEMHLSFHVTSNLTKYNEGNQYAGDNYGETTYEVTFTGNYTNPVTTYFNVEAQEELLQTAIISQRKVIGEVIYNIASCLLRINMLEESVATLEKQVREAGKKTEYSQVLEEHDSGTGRQAYLDEENEALYDLQLKETKMELTVERSKLKRLVGLDLNQALKTDAKSVLKFLANFNPEKLNWRDSWNNTEDRYILRQQVRLEEANIYLAWASYLPGIGLYVNESPGKGQSQPADAQADQFLHVVFDFPLLDWGHRVRDANIAAAQRRQRRLEEIESERQYNSEWLEKEQQLLLAQSRVERWKQSVKNAARRTERMEISYNNGGIPLDVLSYQKQRELDAELSAIKAKCGEAESKLAWMHFASGLTRHFLGEAGYQKAKK